MVFNFDQFLNVEKAVDTFLNKKENLERLIAPLIPTNLEETIQKLIPEVEDWKTPIKWVDYDDGKDGETPDEETLISLIKTQIPEPIPWKDGTTPKKGVDYFTKKELETIKKGLKEAIMSEMTNHATKEEVNIKIEEIKKQINKLPQTGGAQFLRQLMDVNVWVPTAQQYGLTYNPQRSEFSLTAITGGGAVESVTGLNTDNTDPNNPVVRISVDGVTVTGAGTPWSPLVAVWDGTGDVHWPASSTDNAIARYDSTTGKIIQNSGATIDDSGNITAPNLSWTNTGDQPTTDIQVFTSSGTWTKPSGAKSVFIQLIGGGWGGWSGRKGATGTIRYGWGWGWGGGFSEKIISASLLGSTETITVGTWGAWATSQSTNSTNWNTGTDGGNTSCGSHLIAQKGTGWLWGQEATWGDGWLWWFGNITQWSGSWGQWYYSDPWPWEPRSTSIVEWDYTIVNFIAGGGGAGGIDEFDVAYAGAVWWYGSLVKDLIWNIWWTAGSSSAGGNGVAATANSPYGGWGGGGWWARVSWWNAYAGWNGWIYGAGGGGGWASQDSVGNSGAGGNWANGIAIITTYF